MQPDTSALLSASKLERRLRAGEFVVIAELHPPVSADLTDFVTTADQIRPYVDTIQLPDMPKASPHAANIAPGLLLAQGGFDVLITIGCRDRNVIAQQGYLLGAAALGINNILCVTGDHPRHGDHPGAQPVYELDSFRLLKLARRMRDEGLLLNGKRVESPPRVFLGAAAAPDAPPAELRPLHAMRKVEAGANFLQTQPVFDLRAFERYMAQLHEIGVTDKAFVIAGIAYLPSLEAAEQMRLIPDIVIPDALTERLRAVPPDERAEEGMRFMIEMIEGVRAIRGVSGILFYDMPHHRLIEAVIRARLARQPNTNA